MFDVQQFCQNILWLWVKFVNALSFFLRKSWTWTRILSTRTLHLVTRVAGRMRPLRHELRAIWRTLPLAARYPKLCPPPRPVFYVISPHQGAISLFTGKHVFVSTQHPRGNNVTASSLPANVIGFAVSVGKRVPTTVPWKIDPM